MGRSNDGRKRYVERTVRGIKRDAEGELARLLVEAGEGRHAAAEPMTFGELLDSIIRPCPCPRSFVHNDAGCAMIVLVR